MSSLGGGRLCLELSFSTVWVMGQSVFACKKQPFASFFVFCDGDSTIRVWGVFPSFFVLLRSIFMSLSPLHLLPLRMIIIIRGVLICFGLCNHLSLFSSWSSLVLHHHLFISLDLFVMWWCIIRCRGLEGIWRQTLPTAVWRVCWSQGSSGWVCVAGRALSSQKDWSQFTFQCSSAVCFCFLPLAAPLLLLNSWASIISASFLRLAQSIAHKWWTLSLGLLFLCLC